MDGGGARGSACGGPTRIRAVGPDDHEAIVALALRAWAAVFASVNDVLGPDLATLLHGEDWRQHRAREVREALASESMQMWVAEAGDGLTGLVGARVVDSRRLIGEVYIVGVDPRGRHRGVGTALTEHAEQWLNEQGMRVAYISTGADPGHASARRLYERLGYRLPERSAQYFKLL